MCVSFSRVEGLIFLLFNNLRSSNIDASISVTFGLVLYLHSFLPQIGVNCSLVTVLELHPLLYLRHEAPNPLGFPLELEHHGAQPPIVDPGAGGPLLAIQGNR